MELMEGLLTRRSIRNFKADDVPDEIVKQIIKAAGYAPSAHNKQPWEFIITRDSIKKSKLNEGRTWTKFLPATPVVIIVCANTSWKPRKTKDEKGFKYFYIQDTAAAVENLLLAAHSLGLGTCWVGDFDDDTLREIFSIPDDFAPVAVIAMGYPEKVPQNAPTRRQTDEMIHWEKF